MEHYRQMEQDTFPARHQHSESTGIGETNVCMAVGKAIDFAISLPEASSHGSPSIRKPK
jgi:hypothetical protein